MSLFNVKHLPSHANTCVCPSKKSPTRKEKAVIIECFTKLSPWDDELEYESISKMVVRLNLYDNRFKSKLKFARNGSFSDTTA